MFVSKALKLAKIRKIIGSITIISGIATGAFAAVAFTGRKPGNFDISLKQEGTRLAMDSTPYLENPTTFIPVSKYPGFTMSYYDRVFGTYGDKLDSETTNDKVIGVVGDEFTDFFKHTFFVKNMGSTFANFVFSVNITDSTKPTNYEYGFESFLRVGVYENLVTNEEETHNKEFYARKAEYKNESEYPLDENGNKELREPVAGPSFLKYGYATPFVSATRLCERKVTNFAPGQVMRYTVVIWLEGNDRQCSGNAPEDGSLQIGININGEE